MSLREDPDCGAIVRLPVPSRFVPQLVLPEIAGERLPHPDRLVLGATVRRARERFLLADRVMRLGIWLGLGLVIGFVGGILAALHPEWLP